MDILLTLSREGWRRAKMKSTKPVNHQNELGRGRGGLRFYTYWASGILLKSKQAVDEALTLKLTVIRKDKIMDKMEIYSYEEGKFIPQINKKVSQ